MSPPPSLLTLLPLLLLLLVLAAGSFAAANAKTTPSSATAAAGAGAAPPTPTPWPEQYHAVLIINRTNNGGRLRQIDIYYDWPNGRSLNIVHDQLSGEPSWDVQWVNGTEYFFDAASCRTFQYDVGVLPPDWKARGGATYLGRERVDGFDCHVWSNFIFPRYYDDVATGRPVAWINAGSRHYYLQIPVFSFLVIWSLACI
jgi:hypothetical protein